jgi:hypothetical protein
VNPNRCRLVVSVVLSAALAATTATAQSTQPADATSSSRAQDSSTSQPDASAAPESRRPTESKWEVEAHGGVSAISSQSRGAGSLPTTGAIVGGLIGVSSFYLGDGARLFNQNQAAVAGGQSVPAIVSLDSILLGPAIRQQGLGTFGLRIGRAINHRMTVEGTADLSVFHLSFEPAAVTGIEASRASFTPALERALASGAVASTVTSEATVVDRRLASQLFATGALIINLKETGKAIPYVSIGAGAVFNSGDTPYATLVGKYQLADPAQILATDTVTLHYSLNGPTLVWTVGGGVKYLVTPKWGIRFDARAQLYKDATVNLIDVTPVMALESTGSRFPIVTSGALQFSSIAPLNGATVTGATTYAGTGLQTHVVLAAGFFLRF